MPLPESDPVAREKVTVAFDTVIKPGISRQFQEVLKAATLVGPLNQLPAEFQAAFRIALEKSFDELLTLIKANALTTQFAADPKEAPLASILTQANSDFTTLQQNMLGITADASNVVRGRSLNRVHRDHQLLNNQVELIYFNSIEEWIILYVSTVIVLTLYKYFESINQRSISHADEKRFRDRTSELHRLLGALQYKEPQETALPEVEVIVDQPDDKGAYLVRDEDGPASTDSALQRPRRFSKLLSAMGI